MTNWMFNLMIARPVLLYGLVSEPEANNNGRVIGFRQKHAASRGFLATARLLLLLTN